MKDIKLTRVQWAMLLCTPLAILTVIGTVFLFINDPITASILISLILAAIGIVIGISSI